jgi:transcriptional regulator with XRE-family HTH domain
VNVYHPHHGERPEDFWEIRKRFLALRRKARLSQRHLGIITGICRQTISKIENGHVAPWPRTWARFRALEERHNRPPIELPTCWVD